MNDAAPVDSFPEPAAPPQVAANALERALAELEHRVQVLENAVAGLNDTRQLEERITERVVTRIPPPEPPPPPTLPEIALPGAGPVQTAVQSSWLLVDLLGEVRTMLQMLFDRRYHMAWLGRMLAVVLLVAIFTSGWWFPLSWIYAIGGIFEKTLDLFLALILFVLVSRESRRYRDWRAARR